MGRCRHKKGPSGTGVIWSTRRVGFDIASETTSQMQPVATKYRRIRQLWFLPEAVSSVDALDTEIRIRLGENDIYRLLFCLPAPSCATHYLHMCPEFHWTPKNGLCILPHTNAVSTPTTVLEHSKDVRRYGMLEMWWCLTDDGFQRQTQSHGETSSSLADDGLDDGG